MRPDATLATSTTATTKAMKTTWVPTIWYVKYVDVRKTTMRTIQKAGDVDNDGQMTFLDGAVVVAVVIVVVVVVNAVVVVSSTPLRTTTTTTKTTTAKMRWTT